MINIYNHLKIPKQILNLMEIPGSNLNKKRRYSQGDDNSTTVDLDIFDALDTQNEKAGN